MKNEEKKTQKPSGSLSDADLDNSAGGGGQAVAAGQELVKPARPTGGVPTSVGATAPPVKKRP
jgi:hypothetical protein